MSYNLAYQLEAHIFVRNLKGALNPGGGGGINRAFSITVYGLAHGSHKNILAVVERCPIKWRFDCTNGHTQEILSYHAFSILSIDCTV